MVCTLMQASSLFRDGIVVELESFHPWKLRVTTDESTCLYSIRP